MTLQTIEYSSRILSDGSEKLIGRGTTPETQDISFMARAFGAKRQPWENKPKPGLDGSRVNDIILFRKNAYTNHFNLLQGGWDNAPTTEAVISLVDAITAACPEGLAVADTVSSFRGKDGRFENGDIYKNGKKYGSYETRTYDKGLAAARIIPGPPPQPPFTPVRKMTKADELASALEGTWIFDLKVKGINGSTILEIVKGKWVTGNPEADELKEIVKMFSDRFPALKQNRQPVFAPVFLTSEIT
ncbi:MAG: hypothetical protein WBK55_01550 [Alphaproteobacteria bacterium]